MELADADLIAEFAIESQEGLANIEQQLLAIEAAGADVDLELVNSVFRTMHSIKGTAGFLGLDRIGTLAHRLEEVLNHMRNREIVPSSDLVTTVLHAADYMKGLIDAVETSNEADISGYLQKLQKFRPGLELGGDTTCDSTPNSPAAPALVANDSVTPCSNAAGSTVATSATSDRDSATAAGSVVLNDTVREFLIECYENLDQMDRDLLTWEQDPSATHLVRGIFRTMHTIKGGAGFLGLNGLERLAHGAENLLGKLRDGALALSPLVTAALLASIDKCREGLRMLETKGNDAGFDAAELISQLQAAEKQPAETASSCQTTVGAAVGVASAPSQAAVVSESSLSLKPSIVPAPIVGVHRTAPAGQRNTTEEPSTTEKSAGSTEKAPAAAGNATTSVGDTTIRVDVALLDKLMTRVGELVLARNQILQHISRLEDAEFISTAQRLNLITTELQEGVMKTRMQPIGNVWAKFPRVVRDLASQLGKQVRIEMEGKETELDKTIVEAIKDPLTHLVRNSVDHGIEGPAARMAAGKPSEGCLLLRAYHEGGQVNIEISDDGAGLNLDRIRKKAVERGLLTPDQANRLTDREAGQLIFAPGFSTAEKVTSVSGRGVGMDVVKTNIERISGTIDLQSRPGQGTTIKIKIPLTLAIIPALIVTSDGDRYAIPQVSLLELVRLEGGNTQPGIEFVHGAPVYRLRGKLLPLVYLSERLGLAKSNTSRRQASHEGPVNIVVLRADDRQFGLVVDKVNDTEEIVVKPLGKQLKGITEYAGATIMGDGAVALILDVKGLAVASGLGAEVRQRSQTDPTGDTAARRQDSETMLVVDLGDDRRFALPTSMVARLEKISRLDVERTNGQQVIQYRGTILPLVDLAEVVDCPSLNRNWPDELQVVVYDEPGHRYGLVVRRIVDISDVEAGYARTAQPDQYLLGTTVIQQRVTDILDLRALARRTRRGNASVEAGERTS